MRNIIEVRECMCCVCTGDVDQSDQHGLQLVPVLPIAPGTRIVGVD